VLSAMAAASPSTNRHRVLFPPSCAIDRQVMYIFRSCQRSGPDPQGSSVLPNAFLYPSGARHPLCSAIGVRSHTAIW